MNITEGRYKAHAIKGSEQYGEAGSGTLQLAIDLEVPELGRTLTAFLYFSEAATPFSIDRLRTLGWQGDNIRDLKGIDANEVDVDVRTEVFEGQTRWRVEILTGPGRVTLTKSLDKDAFAERVAALLSGGSSKG
jgi:hypothetical protein